MIQFLAKQMKQAKNKVPKISIKKIKKGHKVYDRWYLWKGIGVVLKVLKTKVKIKFGDEIITYDIPHLQFLEYKK